MTDPADRRAGLRLIQGGLQCRLRFGPIEIVAAPQSAAPFEVDALAIEEDTWLIMSAEPTVGDLQEHPIRLMTDLTEARPKPVGSIVVQGRNPLNFMAIVHDVNQDPTCREEWVQDALYAIFREAERRKLRTLGLPLIGTLHGKLVPTRFVDLFNRVLQQTSFKYLDRVWLVAPVPTNADIINRLQLLLNNT
jgi:hypothetical protein